MMNDMNTKCRVLVVEDELPTQRLLKNMIQDLRPQWEIVAATTSIEDTREWLENNGHPDIIFLDIHLSDGLSFAIFDNMEVSSAIIFTTAYDEYAIQAFKLNSVDYLLKPISRESLEAAIVKYEKILKVVPRYVDQKDIRQLATLIEGGTPLYRSRILVPTVEGFLKLNISEVAFFHSSQKVTSAYTYGGQPHVIDMTLEKLEGELDPDKFFRANRQYIIHIDSIQRMETWFNGKMIVKTCPESPDKIVVSREKVRSFKDWINR